MASVFKVEVGSIAQILKIWTEQGRVSEAHSTETLKALQGHSVVKLLQHDESGILLEYLDGSSLKSVALQGQDEFATKILCKVLQSIHSYDGKIPPKIWTLERNFTSLFIRASRFKEDFFNEAAKCARLLIESEQNRKLLHGDLHHENVLYSTTHGWTAIDPKFLFGEWTYDYANIFLNPLDLEISTKMIWNYANIICELTGADRKRLLTFGYVHCALSAAWSIEDKVCPQRAQKIGSLIKDLI